MPSAPLQQFGRSVRRFRLLVGLSQEELASRSGLHRTYIGAIERGERNISLLNIIRIAKALDLFPAELIEHVDSEE